LRKQHDAANGITAEIDEVLPPLRGAPAVSDRPMPRQRSDRKCELQDQKNQGASGQQVRADTQPDEHDAERHDCSGREGM